MKGINFILELVSGINGWGEGVHGEECEGWAGISKIYWRELEKRGEKRLMNPVLL